VGEGLCFRHWDSPHTKNIDDVRALFFMQGWVFVSVR
jgi:hypothetical protein